MLAAPQVAHKVGVVHAAYSRLDQTRPDQTRPDQTRPDRVQASPLWLLLRYAWEAVQGRFGVWAGWLLARSRLCWGTAPACFSCLQLQCDEWQCSESKVSTYTASHWALGWLSMPSGIVQWHK